MKISIYAPAWTEYDEESDVITDVDTLTSVCGQLPTSEQDAIANYLDNDLADLGISGGLSQCRISIDGELILTTDYWAPKKLDDSTLQRLVDYTIAQWEDGIGESGFFIEDATQPLWVYVSTDRGDVEVEQYEDGTPVERPSQIAIYARDGNLDGLVRAIASGEDVNGKFQGCSALHLAILYGHVEIALTLIEGGAAVDVPDIMGTYPLHACALSNEIGDEDSKRVALALLERGADPTRRSVTGETAAEYSDLREKRLLRDLLRRAAS